MTTFNNNFRTLDTSKKPENDEILDNQLDITDVIGICKEYVKIGYQIQFQIDAILKLGVEEAIKNNKVKVQSLPHIKDFLFSICENYAFADAAEESNTIIFLIEEYELNNTMPLAVIN